MEEKIMNNKTINKLIVPRFTPGEEIFGTFYATKTQALQEQIQRGLITGLIAGLIFFITHSFWWVLGCAILTGIFNALLGSSYLKTYCFVVTNKGIHQASQQSIIPYLGSSVSYSFYPFENIKTIKINEGYFSSTLELDLKEGNNASLIVNRFPGMTKKTKEYLLSKVAKHHERY